MINGHCTCIHFTSENGLFLIFVCHRPHIPFGHSILEPDRMYDPPYRCCSLSIYLSCASDCLETGKPYKDLIQWRHEADKVTSGLSGASLRSKSQRSKLHRTIISRTYFRQNGIDLLQTKNEMIKNILHIIKCISPAEMLGFCDICLPTIPFVHSKLECGRKFTFFVNVTPYASEWWCNSKIKRSRSRSRSLGTKMKKSYFAHMVATKQVKHS